MEKELPEDFHNQEGQEGRIQRIPNQEQVQPGEQGRGEGIGEIRLRRSIEDPNQWIVEHQVENPRLRLTLNLKSQRLLSEQEATAIGRIIVNDLALVLQDDIRRRNPEKPAESA